jgi:hypothetical protein
VVVVGDVAETDTRVRIDERIPAYFLSVYSLVVLVLVLEEAVVVAGGATVVPFVWHESQNTMR